MTIGGVGGYGPPRPNGTSDQQLREASRALEGVFLSYMYKAMRATVPAGGLFASTPGEDLFSAMFDEHMASITAQESEGTLGDLLYRQLRNRIEASREGSPSEG